MEQASAVVPSLPENSINLYAFAFVLVLMLLGATIHWIKLRRSKRTNATLLEYIFTDNPMASAKAGGSIFVIAAMAAGTGVSDWIDPVLLWEIVSATHTMPSICFFGIGAAVAAGYAMDSGFNAAEQPAVKAEEKSTTDEEKTS
ncbi:MAG: hypothetical protein WC236_09665 [Gallionellaceae bacterium]|jgi:hypothetical protein